MTRNSKRLPEGRPALVSDSQTLSIHKNRQHIPRVLRGQNGIEILVGDFYVVNQNNQNIKQSKQRFD